MRLWNADSGLTVDAHGAQQKHQSREARVALCARFRKGKNPAYFSHEGMHARDLRNS